jgi:hypothetical protein
MKGGDGGPGGTEVGLASLTCHPLGLIFVSCVSNSISFLKKHIFAFYFATEDGSGVIKV